MSIFDTLGTPTAPQPRTMQQELGQLKAGPGAYLRARGYNVPDGMTDASQIAQYLLRSGQIENPRYQMAMRLLNSMRR